MVQLREQAVLGTVHRPSYKATPGSGRLQCLIVCPDGRRRRELVDQASEAGWITYETADISTAIDLQLRMMLHLAIVDFTGATPAVGVPMRQLVIGLSRERDLLLMVCGHGSAEEEIWARQLGIWIYLPGLIDPAELSPLFGEARDLAERLTATRGSPLSAGASYRH